MNLTLLRSSVTFALNRLFAAATAGFAQLKAGLIEALEAAKVAETSVLLEMVDPIFRNRGARQTTRKKKNPVFCPVQGSQVAKNNCHPQEWHLDNPACWKKGALSKGRRKRTKKHQLATCILLDEHFEPAVVEFEMCRFSRVAEWVLGPPVERLE